MAQAKVISITAGRDRVLLAEQSLLGSILFEPKALPLVEPLITSQDFAFPAHGWIYQGILDSRELENDFSLVTVTEHLHRNGRLDSVGGPKYLTDICDNIGTAAQAEHFAKVIREASVSRQYAAQCQKNHLEAEQAVKGELRLHDVLSKHESELFAISRDYYKSHNIFSVGEVVSEELSRLENISTTGRQDGVKTGFYQIDRVLHSLQPTELAYLAARPGVGKTGLALNIANNCNAPVGFFSLEMSASELAKRQLSLVSGIDGWAIKTLRLMPEQWAELAKATIKLKNIQVFIDDKPQLTIQELRSKARQLVSQFRVKLVVIDYLQLMKTTKGRSREQEISDISAQLKAMAKELQISVLALAQLNREVEKRDSGEPKLSDLRESGSLEQDADVVIFLWPAGKDSIEVNFKIAKNRNGRTGQGKLIYRKDIQRFEDLED
jgi:replicative DNA helicase